MYFMLQNVFSSVKNVAVCWCYFTLDNPFDFYRFITYTAFNIYNTLCTHLTTFLNTEI